jgi:uncharacterized membrane protein
MGAIKTFIKNTIIGGLFFLIPLVFLYIILEKARHILGMVVKPLAEKWQISSLLGKSTVLIMVILSLVIICFLGGLLLKLPFFKNLYEFLDEKVLRFIPGYKSIKMSAGKLTGEVEKMDAVFLKHEDAWIIAYIVEESNGYSTIFKPDAPSHKEGEIIIKRTVDLVTMPLPARDANDIIFALGRGAAGKLASLKK